MKKFESTRLILREWSRADLNNLHEVMCNKKVADLAGFRVKENIKETNVVLEKFTEEPDDTIWAIELKELNKVVGWIEVHTPIDNIFKEAKEIGFVLAEAFWGLGIAIEAINEIIQYSFNDKQISSIVCSHFINNTQSKKVIERSGFKYKITYNNKIYYYLNNEVNYKK
ncbi:GNAT family N-acetyltransferase [Clostridium sp. D53t1_180928_C8]|uniref:GNAT family N-acetyltransferase n=1 Tax=Clostridium sp. D53t1_180928_C8 TaxID=2787101 RepID=UPI0018A88989|nr:GNAT family N-acetyltransferase [Clostridium sp. D53t1_180928_C8]